MNRCEEGEEKELMTTVLDKNVVVPGFINEECFFKYLVARGRSGTAGRVRRM